MSVNQDKIVRKGRPVSPDLFSLPQDFEEALVNIGFFRKDTNPWKIKAQLPIADKIDRIYRFRAAVARAMAKEERSTVERVTGKSWKQLNRYLAGATIPVAVMELVAMISDLSAAWVISGTIEEARRSVVDAASNTELLLAMNGRDRYFVTESAKRIASDFPALRIYHRTIDVDEIVRKSERGSPQDENEANFRVPPGHLEIDRYDLHASAGNGSKQFDERSASRWTIPRELLRGYGGNGETLMSTDIVGDSMEPTLQDGQAIIVDKSARFDREAVYLLTVGDELFVKRLRRVPGQDGEMSLSLISDNPAYPEVTLGPDTQERVRIIGRVIWPDTSRRRF